MLDHLGEGRFEFGTGRGSSSTEVYGFGIDSMERTRELYDEALPQIVRMWAEDDYSYEGDQLLDAAPSGAAQALHRPASAALGRRRLTGDLREGGPARPRGAVLHPRHARHAGAAHRDLQEEHRQRRAGRRLRERQHHGDRRHAVPGRRRPGPPDLRRQPHQLPHRAWCSSTSTRSPAPRGCRCGPTCCPTPTMDELRDGANAAASCVGDPDEISRTVQRFVDIGADQLTFASTTVDYDMDVLRESYELFGARDHPPVRHRPGALHDPPAGGAVRRLLRHPLRGRVSPPRRGGRPSRRRRRAARGTRRGCAPGT